MGTKNNPGEFDCYANAEDDEPMFILLARDDEAPRLVDEWVNLKFDKWFKRYGEPIPDDKADKLMEAKQCARAMRLWRRENPDK